MAKSMRWHRITLSRQEYESGEMAVSRAHSGQLTSLETGPRAWRCLDAGLMMELAISFIPRLDRYGISTLYWTHIQRIRSIRQILPVYL